MAGTIEGAGLIARVSAALRYAVTGTMPGGWFGPLSPPVAQAPDEVRGRQFDYGIGINLNFRPRATEALGFDGLKKLAAHPIVAMLIQRQKDKVSGLDWKIKPRLDEDGDMAEDPAVRQITDFLRYPDQEHDWVQWISAVLDQLLVIDAVTIYGAPNRRGDLYALQVLDGAMIKPVLDLGGRRPLAPEPAYQQILKGIPAINYSADEIVYFPQVYRADRYYGYSRVEQARDLIETAISRLRSQKSYFDFGNVGDGYFTAPDIFNGDQIKGLQDQWNAIMQNSDPASRRIAPFLPSGTDWHPTKVDILADTFDEYLIRLMCFPFGVAATPFLKQSGLGNSNSSDDHEAAEEGGIAPLMSYIERLMSMIVAKWFDRPDLEFAFVENREFDPKVAADIDDIRLKNGSAVINEIRDRNGEKPIPGGDVPLIYGTATRLEDAIKEPVVPAPLLLPAAKPGAEEDDATEEVATPALEKAAATAATKRFMALLGEYLAAKARVIAAALADDLVKAAPPPVGDDYAAQIEAALAALDWHWDDLPEILRPVLAGVATAAGANAISELGLFDAETLKRVTARAVAYAEARGAELVGMRVVGGVLITNPDAAWSISEVTRTMLRKAVTNAMSEGLSNADLAKTIIESTAFSSKRAENIARTETAIADVRGSAMGWIESGVVGSAQFDASPDCCEDCQAEDGKIVELSDPDDLELPHPGCRCAWVAVVDETQPGAADTETED